MHDTIDPVCKMLPKDQWDFVMNQRDCDIEPVFMGFTEIYKNLSEIIPKHFTIIDLGCAYAPQCVYFKDHKKYIGVDISDCQKFSCPNSSFFVKSIEKFCLEDIVNYNLNETFAICSYVPPWGANNQKIVRETFINVFTYYPCGGYTGIEINQTNQSMKLLLTSLLISVIKLNPNVL